MDDFLPKDYKEPVTSNYMQFEEGDNRFRVMPAKEGKTTLIMGWEYWKTIDGKRKPIRVRKDETVSLSELEIDPRTGELDQPKFFWAMAVWNYKAERIQILEIKQKTVRQAIDALARNPKWGSPVNYDVVVTQTVEKGKTSYSVAPDPKEEIDQKILELYNNMSINLDALYLGEDPFSTNEKLVNEDVDISDEELEETFASV